MLGKDLARNWLNSINSVKMPGWLGWIIRVIKNFRIKVKTKKFPSKITTKEHLKLRKTTIKTIWKISDSLQKENFFTKITTYDWRFAMKKMTSKKSLKSFLVQGVIVFEVYEKRKLRAFHCWPHHKVDCNTFTDPSSSISDDLGCWSLISLLCLHGVTSVGLDCRERSLLLPK